MVGFSKQNGLPLVSPYTNMIKEKLPLYQHHHRHNHCQDDLSTAPTTDSTFINQSRITNISNNNNSDDQLLQHEDGDTLMDELLPPYTCTVYKMGYVKVKQESGFQTLSSKRIRWRKYYIRLWGTVLHMYKNKDETSPLYTLSMQRVEAGLAPEFSNKPNVLRLRAPSTGDQFLMRLINTTDMVSWIEHLQAAANISLDLDYRKMPRFVTMTRPNNNQSTTTANLTLSLGNRTVVTLCQYEGRARNNHHRHHQHHHRHHNHHHQNNNNTCSDGG